LFSSTLYTLLIVDRDVLGVHDHWLRVVTNSDDTCCNRSQWR